MELCQYPCQNRTRYFTIEAIQIPIVYNRYGDYDPDGLLYVLEKDSQRIREEAVRRFHQMPPQPCAFWRVRVQNLTVATQKTIGCISLKFMIFYVKTQQ